MAKLEVGRNIFPRSAFIGFDHLFNELDFATKHAHDHYPPHNIVKESDLCLLYTSPSPRDKRQSRMPSSA